MTTSQDPQVESDIAVQLTAERSTNARLLKLINAHSKIAATKLNLDTFFR